MSLYKSKDEVRRELQRGRSAARRASQSGSQASETWRLGDLGLKSLPPLRSLCPHPQLIPRRLSPGHVVAGAEQWDRVPGRDAEQYCGIRGLGGRAGRRAKCTAYCHAVGIICCCFQRGGGDVSDLALLLPAAPTVASARRALHGYLPSCAACLLRGRSPANRTVWL